VDGIAESGGTEHGVDFSSYNPGYNMVDIDSSGPRRLKASLEAGMLEAYSRRASSRLDSVTCEKGCDVAP